MGTHYYSIKDANKIGDQPVSHIMTTTGHVYYSVGIYELSKIPHTFIRLTHISRWDYDMLDAFGVEVVSSSWLGRMDKLYA